MPCGPKPAVEGRPKLAAWWGDIQERESIKKVLAEQGATLEALQKQQQDGQAGLGGAGSVHDGRSL